jgi:hypothetical protein
MSGDHQIHCEILRRAAEGLGGEDRLAQHLDVTPDQMHNWMQGKATACAGVYLIALDILSRSSSVRQEESPESVESCGTLDFQALGTLRDGKDLTDECGQSSLARRVTSLHG